MARPWQSPVLVKVHYLGVLPTAMIMALLILLGYLFSDRFAGFAPLSFTQPRSDAAQHPGCGDGAIPKASVRTDAWPVLR